jgi:hypothetical protein
MTALLGRLYDESLHSRRLDVHFRSYCALGDTRLAASGTPAEIALSHVAPAHRHFHVATARSLDQLSPQSKLREIGRMEGATAKTGQ